MRCSLCHNGETRPGRVTVVLQRGEATVICKNVPGDVCENCGEYYLAEAVTQELFKRAESALENGAEVEILRFAA